MINHAVFLTIIIGDMTIILQIIGYLSGLKRIISFYDTVP